MNGILYCCFVALTAFLCIGKVTLVEGCDGAGVKCMHMEPYHRVNVTLYSESLCPDCYDFFQSQLDNAYLKVGQIMTLDIVPYGNARESYEEEGGKWIFECQHGKQECVGNMLQTCAIYVLKEAYAFFPFISCMEARAFSEQPMDAARQCAELNRIDFQPILECSTSFKGNQLQHQMALRTMALNPPHTGVPWITLNRVHTEKIQERAVYDLVSLVCDSYTGPSQTRPRACSR